MSGVATTPDHNIAAGAAQRAPPAGSAFGARLRPQPFLLLAQLRRDPGAEVGGLEHRPDLDFALARMRVGAALQPLDRLVHRLHLPEPEAGDELLCLGKRSVRHRALPAREPDARPFAAALQP